MHWRLYPQYADLQQELARSLDILPVTALVLINRGITTVKSGRSFLYPSLQNLHDPFLMADMEKAVSRIIKAIVGKEKISIYGDYDADGATSTAVLTRFFDVIGVKTDYYIPNRIEEGYGVHKNSIECLKKRGTELVITVDNGITAYDEIAYANELGLDVIITDHHEPKEKIPPAFAVINPKRKDCSFPFKDLAGVGVVFNLIIGLRQRLRESGFFSNQAEPRLREFLDLVAVGTVADVVPLIDENRIFVKFGLEELKKTSNRGLNALKVISGLEAHQINSTSIAFRIAPRINAAGRIDDQYLGPRLLTLTDPEEASAIAQKLHGVNSKRQSIEEVILKEAYSIIEGDPSFEKSLCITLARPGWHPGVIGIVAARLADRFKKPSAVISLCGEVGKGSVRSVGEYNIMSALNECEDLLIGYGGHKHAAGITVLANNIAKFTERFNEAVSSSLTEEDRNEKIFVDAEIDYESISDRLVDELDLIEPFGEGNPEPTFCMRELKVSKARIVAEKHLKLKFSGDMVIFDAIGFGMGHHDVGEEDVLDVAFTPQRDTWRGEGALQLKLRDLKVI